MHIEKIVDEKSLDQNFLSSFKNCPVCSSEKRSRRTSNDERTNLYFEAIATYFKTNEIQLHKKIKVFVCDECNSEYCDPWFKTEVSDLLYSVIFGKHRQGWNKFNYWANDEEKTNVSMGDLDVIWRYVEKYAKKVDSYAELNCPFQGFFGKFTKVLYKKDNNYKNKSLNHLIHMRKAYEQFPFPGYAVELPKQPSTNIPKDRTLIVEPTSMFWGSNCSSDNVSCHSTALSLFGVRKLDLKDIEREKIKFDVLGAYNVIDHFYKPLEMISKLTKISRLVVLTLHGLNDIINKQHLFKFGPDFPNYLKKIGYNVLVLPLEETAADPEDIENSLTILVSKSIQF